MPTPQYTPQGTEEIDVDILRVRDAAHGQNTLFRRRTIPRNSTRNLAGGQDYFASLGRGASIREADPAEETIKRRKNHSRMVGRLNWIPRVLIFLTLGGAAALCWWSYKINKSPYKYCLILNDNFEDLNRDTW